MEVIETEEISMMDIPVEKRPPIKFEVLKCGSIINAKIPQSLIGGYFTLKDGTTELYLKGIENPIIVKGSAQEIMTKFLKKNKKQYRQLKWSEIKQVNMPEEIIGPLTTITVLMENGKYEKATKLYRKDSDEYIIIRGSVLEILQKMCPTIKVS